MDIEAKLSDAVDFINANDVTSFRDTVTDILLQKANDRIDTEKLSMASTLFTSDEVEVTPEEADNESF
tara:strand:- start:3537 stop:3740 length:204 start_codon:yes stop_codon:yes gene_type:complete